MLSTFQLVEHGQEVILQSAVVALLELEWLLIK